MTCASCHSPLYPGDVFCVQCGTRVPAAFDRAAAGPTRAMAAAAAPAAEPCPGCRMPAAADDRFCQSCGRALDRVAVAVSDSDAGAACAGCGESLYPDDVFCVRCGRRAIDPPVAGVPAQPARPITRVLASLAAGRTSITPSCPSCGVATIVGDRFCQGCGHQLSGGGTAPAALSCPGCGDGLFPDDTFCVSCGTRVGQAAPAPAGTGGRSGTRVMTALAEGRTSITPPCPHCGTATVPGEAFCAACGIQVAEGAAQPKSPRPAGARPGEAEIVIDRRDAADLAWDEVRRKLERVTRGEYDIGKEIGRGGMAAVFLAHDIALNRKIAIKVMAPGLLMGKGMVERFSREAQTVANLSHPNIIQIYTVRHADDLHFFVMKYVEGNSLQSILEATGPLPLEVARQVLYQVGSGLAYAHRRGIVHRDIKPANILIDTDGTAVVMDFGIAKVAEEGGAGHSGMTQAGTVVGTPAYMSPEQCYSAEVTWAADQYSLGVVGFELLTGRPPFEGTPFEVMQAHAQEEPPRIRPSRPDCPAAVETALLRMLEKKATDRHPTMAAALDAIGAEPAPAGDPVHQEMAALARVEVDPARPGQPQTPRSPLPGFRRSLRRGRKRAVPAAAWIGGGGAAALGIVAATWFLLQRDGTVPATDSLPAAGPGAGPVARVELSTRRDSVLVGATLSLRATPSDSAGRPVPGRPVLWTSSDSTVASVTGQAGEAVVTGRRAGRAVIAAVVDGRQETAEIAVTTPRRSAVTVATTKREIMVGERLVLGGLLTDSAGARDPRAVFQWRSGTPAIAEVDRTGAVVAKAAGRVRITATSGPLSGFVDLVVKGPQATAITLFAPGGQLTAGRSARVRLQIDWEGGVAGDGASAQWRTSDPAIAAIAASDSAGATVALLKEGDVTIIAELGGVRGATGLSVRGAAAVTIDLSRTAVAFETTPEGTPADQSVTVAVRGTEDNPTVGRIEFTGTGGWLTAQLQGAILTLHATARGLPADSYRATVPVAVGGMIRNLPVTMTVAAPVVNAAAELERTREELQAVLDRYARALVARDSAAIRSLYPGISDRGLQDVVRARLADGYEIQLRRNAPIDPGSQPGTVQVEVSAGVLTGGGANFQRLLYTFSRSGGGWRIVGVRPVR